MPAPAPAASNKARPLEVVDAVVEVVDAVASGTATAVELVAGTQVPGVSDM